MSNPFHEPGSFLAERGKRRRENFKVGVYAVLLTAAVFLAGMLIQGCRGNRITSEADNESRADLAAAPTNSALGAEEKQPQTDSSTSPTAAAPTSPSAVPVTNAPSNPAASAPNEGLVAIPTPAPILYVIKPGDSLSRIAATHGTTVQALKAANGLRTDQIVAGKKLKLPQPNPPAAPATRS